jgi:putative glycosyltransferase (TIGR04372 family)
MQRLKYFLIRQARAAYYLPHGRRLITFALGTGPGRALALRLLKQINDPANRRLMIEGIQVANATPDRHKAFIEAARRYFAADPNNPVRFDIIAIAMLNSALQKETLALLNSAEAKKFLANDAVKTSLFGARISVGHEIELCRDVVVDARRAVDVTPGALRARIDFLKSAYAAGKLRRERDAIEFVGRQFKLVSDHPGPATDAEIEKILDVCAETTIHTVRQHVEFQKFKTGKDSRIGIFFLSSTQALGHAVLDPYYFIALNRDKFDKFYFVGPPRASYRPASRGCLQIVEQYGDYIETDSDLLMNLSWMSLGHHTVGNYTLMIDHYWALLRAAVHRTHDARDDFRHNRWHFTLPPYYDVVGEAFCAERGIDLRRPLIVMHVRDKGYHGIARQSFRDSSVESYRAAVEYLLARGYQVVRIGDGTMPRLAVTAPGYFELPFLDNYRHELDPFLIARSRFMIGCQSGPCAFARALGVPILTINAVLHYTLLPSTLEMACFKRYFKTTESVRVEMSVHEALDARADQLDNSYHFEREGIAVENATAEEILAATRDMDAWIDNPKLEETPEQVAFRERVAQQNDALGRDGLDLALPIADYIGISLDGYRISPSVARMRAEPAAIDVAVAVSH